MEHLCTLKKEGSGYSLELSFDSTKSALDAALEILAFADADCYLADNPKDTPCPPDTQQDEVQQIPFDELLYMLRKRKNLSQGQLASAFGVTKQTICCWERRKKKTEAHYRSENSSKNRKW